jgi:histidinol-phosphate/aromatic aminotransferase/cobyric acid decarboxylase-like protein
VSRRRRLTDYYRQFEALSPEENAERLIAKRRAEQAGQLELTPDLDLATTAWHEPPDPEIVNAATFALRRRLNRYPELGAGPAVRAIAAHHGVPAERVALGHGAGQLLQAALRELATGGEAVLPWPSWSPLPALARRAGVQPVPVPLGADGAVDLDALQGALNDRTRAIVICSPNDPTGALVDREDLRAFAAGLPPEVSVLLDEALVELAGEDASAIDLVGEVENLLVFRSFSKAWSMAGLRAGYLVGPAADENLIGLLEPGQGVASPTQAAVAAALENPDRAAKRLGRRRDAAAAEQARLRAKLEDTPFAFAPSSAHVVWLSGTGMTAAQITRGLAEQRVHVASGAEWDDEHHVRITLRDAAATDRLIAALATLS